MVVGEVEAHEAPPYVLAPVQGDGLPVSLPATTASLREMIAVGGKVARPAVLPVKMD